MDTNSRRFDEPFWTFGEVLGWIIDRDPATVGRFYRPVEYLAENRYKKLKNKPLRELRLSLQQGDLIASDPEKGLIDRNYWRHKDTSGVLACIMTKLNCSREEVLAIWPISYGNERRRGRPSKIPQSIIIEFRRRVAAGEADPTLACEARTLLELCKQLSKPGEKMLAVETIENKIRNEHRAYRKQLAVASDSRP